MQRAYLLGFSMYSLFPWNTQYCADSCLKVTAVAQAPSSTHSQLGVARSRMWVSASRRCPPVLLVCAPDEISRKLLMMQAAWPSLAVGELPATFTCRLLPSCCRSSALQRVQCCSCDTMSKAEKVPSARQSLMFQGHQLEYLAV